jgi:chromosome segregation ATPase
MPNKINRDSPLVKTVLALDNYLTELERVGAKINSTDMTSDFDVEHMQKLMTRFAECGHAVSEEVTNLSRQLHEARTRAEAVATGVSGQAESLNKRRIEQNDKVEEFRILTEKVRDLNTVMSHFQRPHGQSVTPEDRATLSSEIAAFETQLAGVIEELQDFRKSARTAHMRSLEKNAESLAQALQGVQKKLRDLN